MHGKALGAPAISSNLFTMIVRVESNATICNYFSRMAVRIDWFWAERVQLTGT